MKYEFASSTFDEQEKQAILDVIDSDRFTMGQRVACFEREFAEFFGARYAVMVNSGSSANLLAVASTIYHSNRFMDRGDEIIVPAVSWSTTFFPLHQYGLKLKFVDVDRDTLCIDPEKVKEAVTDKTKAIMAVNLLGSPCNYDKLNDICHNNDLLLLEDNCESMGAKYNGKYTGTFGHCGTFSMFFSHHICTIEGGMVLTDDEETAHILKSLRAHGWTRELPEKNHLCNKTGNDFEDLYVFVVPSYNLRPTEISAAIGQVQLGKLPTFIENRKKNASYFKELFEDADYFRMQKPLGDSSWFGFSMVLDGRLNGRRRDVIAKLEEMEIETRPIAAGNFTKNPVFKYMDSEICGPLVCADEIEKNGLFAGNGPKDLTYQLDLLKQSYDEVLVDADLKKTA